MIERAMALSSTPRIEVQDLPEAKMSRLPPLEPTAFPPEGLDLERLLSDFERGWVTRALEHAGGVRKKAAALLGVSFRSLRYRLVKLGIERDDAPAADDVEPDPSK